MNRIEFAKQAGRCWKGYEPVPGKTPYSDGSCQPVGSKKKKPKNSATKTANNAAFTPAASVLAEVALPQPATAAVRREALQLHNMRDVFNTARATYLDTDREDVANREARFQDMLALRGSLNKDYETFAAKNGQPLAAIVYDNPSVDTAFEAFDQYRVAASIGDRARGIRDARSIAKYELPRMTQKELAWAVARSQNPRLNVATTATSPNNSWQQIAATGGGSLAGGGLANLLHRLYRKNSGSALERILATAAGAVGGGAVGYAADNFLRNSATKKAQHNKFASGLGGLFRGLGSGLRRGGALAADYGVPAAAGIASGYAANDKLGLDPVSSGMLGLAAASIASPRDYKNVWTRGHANARAGGWSPATGMMKEFMPLAGNKAKFVGLSLVPAAGSTLFSINKNIGDIGKDIAETTKATKETLKGNPDTPDKPGVLQSWRNAADNVTNIIGDPKTGTGVGGSASQSLESLNKTVNEVTNVFKQPKVNEDGTLVLDANGQPVLQTPEDFAKNMGKATRETLLKDTLLDLKSPYTWAAGGLGLGALGITGLGLMSAVRNRRRKRDENYVDY